MMKILVATNLWPNSERPQEGAFIAKQVEALRERGLSVEIFYVDRKTNGILQYFYMRQRFKQACLSYLPDLIHVMYGGVLAYQIVRVAHDLKIPCVVSFCGSDLLGQIDAGYRRLLISYVGVLASFAAIQGADGVIVKSENLKNRVDWLRPTQPVYVIPNAVDTRMFYPMDQKHCRQRLALDLDAFYVLFVDSGDPLKRPHLARLAVERARRFCPYMKLLVLKGVAHHEVRFWLNASNALILTSRHEGSPNIVKEALACATPVVSVPVGDVQERIKTPQAGYVVESSVFALSQALIQLYDDSAQKSTEKLWPLAVELSETVVSEKIMQVYQRVLSAHAVAEAY